MRGRILTALALALAALLTWVAAPALSLRPYVPDVANFEAALPEAKRLPHERGHAHEQEVHTHASWISPPVTAPHEFDLVGVAGERREVEIRVRSSSGVWSDWVAQEEATPIYVDGADEAQVRAEFRPEGRLHFVNVSGTADSTGERLLDG